MSEESGLTLQRTAPIIGESFNSSSSLEVEDRGRLPMRKMTHDPIPHVEHYLDPGGRAAKATGRQRPTLMQLHEVEREDFYDAENEIDENLDGLGGGVAGGQLGDPKATKVAPKFGWIIGVFVRCLLNIFGVMLFMRISWVVGQAGLGLCTVIILLACTVTFLTALSMSAICTNGEVKGGGAYYMISRSLGPEFGGAIGIIFALANAVAVAMYVIGFAETIRDILKDHGRSMTDDLNDVRIIGFITIIALLGIALAGLDWEARAQVFLLIILTVAIANVMIGSFIPPSTDSQMKGFIGYTGKNFKNNFTPDFREGYEFFTVFAIFFPAATGILAGANISGDLKNAQTAIPKGTLLAILLTTIIYLIIAWMCGLVVERDSFGPLPEFINRTLFYNLSVEYLQNSSSPVDVLIMDTSVGNQTSTCVPGTCKYGLLNDMRVTQLMSVFGPITIAGIVSATLSSALASLISAPKVFQAVCRDKIFPGIGYFGKGFGQGQEPRRAYVLTFGIGVACICIGDLNTIAPLISNFFLMSYGLICYSCADSSLAKSPGWRPAFKYYNVWSSLLGTVLCISVMFVINWWTALITIALVLILYFYVHYRKPEINWGSSTQAHVYRNALQHTQKLIVVLEHVKNYRPQILVMSGLPNERPALVDLCGRITKKISLMVCGHVLLPDDTEHTNNDSGRLPRTNSFGFLTSLNTPVEKFSRSRNASGSALHGSTTNLSTTDAVGESWLSRQLGDLAYRWLALRRVHSFYSTVYASSLRLGIQALMQASGLGKLKPNMLVLGFKSNWKTCKFAEVEDFFNIIHDAFDLNYGVGVLRVREGLDCSRIATPLVEKTVNEANKQPEKSPGRIAVLFKKKQNKYTMNSSPSHSLQANNQYVAKGTSNSAYFSGSSNSLGEGAVTRISGTANGVEEMREPTSDTGYTFSERELRESSERFNRKKQEGTIDVWWLADDGGLTLLIPYLLTTRKYWSSCKLRVFMTTSKPADVNLDEEHKHMATLLHKFRIEYSSITLVSDIGKTPTYSSLKSFDELIAGWIMNQATGETKDTHPWKITQEELTSQRDKTYRHLRIQELLKYYSMGANIIFLTLPIPRKGVCPAGLYMAWMDIMTRDMPPIMMIRGNQESVLTYYS